MARYERITIKGNARNRTGWFEVLADTGGLVLLRPVDAVGEDFSFYNAEGVVVDKQELVSADLIVKRQPAHMNLHYGTLEVTP